MVKCIAGLGLYEFLCLDESIDFLIAETKIPTFHVNREYWQILIA